MTLWPARRCVDCQVPLVAGKGVNLEAPGAVAQPLLELARSVTEPGVTKPGLLGRVAFPAELLMKMVIGASLCSLRCFCFRGKIFPGELQWFGFQSCFVCGL